MRGRFEREAQAVAALSHPGIVGIHEMAVVSGRPFIVMELLQGESLRARIDKAPIPWQETAKIGLQVAEALTVAHQKGIVHRDLKPENVFLTRVGQAKILDFGVAQWDAKALHQQASYTMAWTMPGTVVGTIGYISPEQIQGQPATGTSDVFALGATLMEMVTGQSAFRRASPLATFGAVISEPPAGIDELRSRSRADFAAFVLQCVEKDPEQRIRTAREVVNALRAMTANPAPRVRPMTSGSPQYDLVVIGSGPAGQRAAIGAAKLGKRVVMIEKREMLGGMQLGTGTIPSKTLREAVLYLSGFYQRSFYGREYSLKDQINVSDLTSRLDPVMQREHEVIRAQLKRNGVVVRHGEARFVDARTISVETPEGAKGFSAARILIACGSRAAKNPKIPIGSPGILDADTVNQLKRIPKSTIVVGGGVIGLEYASMLSALGAQVTLIDQRPALLDFIDTEIVESLTYHLRHQGIVLRLGETVTDVTSLPSGVVAKLESGKTVHADGLLYCVGRQPNSDQLDLENAGVEADARGRIKVNAHFQTTVPHIYAAGDVIGFPSLAAASMEQGRIASLHMFGLAMPDRPQLVPYGIYTIPEISMVGATEQQLTSARIPYEVGIANFAELAKGHILGDQSGLLKLLFDPSSLRLLGAHIIGQQSTELIHIAQTVMAFEGTVEYFRDTVFNYPTLAEAYKVAALHGLNKVRYVAA
jgi:NAD(P) transhydrogenase